MSTVVQIVHCPTLENAIQTVDNGNDSLELCSVAPLGTSEKQVMMGDVV